MSIKKYSAYNTGIANKKGGLIRRLFRLLVQLMLLSVLALFAILLIFRWVPVPTSAFIYMQNSLAQESPNIYENAAYEWIDWNDIPPQIALAVIAAEDQRFPSHWGVDTVELKKVLLERRSGNKLQRGASTITQQTAKNLFLWNGRSYTRKIIEVGISIALEITWPKRRILEVYLNIAQFGEAIFGIKEASRLLFDKEPKELTREEAAMLAAVLPKPAISDVNDPRPELRKRQQWILKQMKQLGGVRYLNKI